MKKAISLYEGHNQPFEPLNDNYYDLSEKNSIQWQINLAKQYADRFNGAFVDGYDDLAYNMLTYEEFIALIKTALEEGVEIPQLLH